MNFQIRLLIQVSILCLVLPSLAFGQIEMPELFSDHMVLQRNMPIPVWGKASPDETLSLTLGDNQYQVKADFYGNWKTDLPAMKAGGPFELKIQSSNQTILIKDILIGEVWLCSGQSNMEWPLKKTAEAEREIPKANRPQIRLFHLKKKHDMYKAPFTPEQLKEFTAGHFFYPAKWETGTPETAAEFSGVGYFFGKELQDSLHIPIGLIQNAVGGSPAQSWISKEALASHPQLGSLVNMQSGKTWLDSDLIHPWTAVRAKQNWANWEREESKPLPGHPFAPTYLYDFALKPLAPYAIRGVIWYQGESNASHPDNYYAMMETLIKSWRSLWGQGDFPFLFVQLPRIDTRNRWADFRATQEGCLAIPNTEMVVMIDEGMRKDVHPRRKEVVGQRMARLALAKTYGKGFLAQSPSFSHYQWTPGDQQILLHFKQVGEGLSTKDDGPIRGFRLQGFSQQGGEEVIIKPEIIASNKNSILLGVPDDFLLLKIKYAWAPFPENNVVNSVGLPLAPFKVEMQGFD